MSDILPITDRTRLRRASQRGAFDRETLYAILDAMPLCHIGYILNGSTIVMPTLQWREGDHVYWHASSAARGFRAALTQEVCLTVSLFDGLVLARSAMHHSANFRAAMIFGRPQEVTDPDQKVEKLKSLIEHFYPGRWDQLRPMTEQEAKATSVLSLPIEEASAKIRTGGVQDDEDDYSLPIWAGVIPLSLQMQPAIPDPRNLPDVEMPDHATYFKFG